MSGRPIEEVLESSVSLQASRSRMRTYLAGRPDIEDAAYAGLTIGDMLYDVARVDPLVLGAADFARAEDLSSVFSFGALAARIRNLDDAARAGSQAQIQGYVAERLVAQDLQSQGFEVEFPAASNEPGYDLLVNGHPYQVKCLADPSGVYEHLDKYPDIPVFVNCELAEQFSGTDRVFSVPSVSHGDVVEATNTALDSGAEILDLEIPLIALTVAMGRNAWAVATNRTDLVTGILNASVDTFGGSLGGAAGAALGAATVGLWIASGYLTIVAPIIGSVAGAGQGRRIARRLRARIFCRAEEQALESSIASLLARARGESEAKLRIIRTKAECLETSLCQMGRNGQAVWETFGWRLEQEIAYSEHKLSQFRSYMTKPSQLDTRGADLIVSAGEAALLVVEAGVPPFSVKAELDRLAFAIEDLKRARRSLLLGLT